MLVGRVGRDKQRSVDNSAFGYGINWKEGALGHWVYLLILRMVKWAVVG